MYWTGPLPLIQEAETQISQIVSARRAWRGQNEVPNPTLRWAIPQETTQLGIWAMPAPDFFALPQGCALDPNPPFAQNPI